MCGRARLTLHIETKRGPFWASFRFRNFGLFGVWLIEKFRSKKQCKPLAAPNHVWRALVKRDPDSAEQHRSRGKIDFIHMDAHLAFLNMGQYSCHVSRACWSTRTLLFCRFRPARLIFSFERRRMRDMLEQASRSEFNSLNWICVSI